MPNSYPTGWLSFTLAALTVEVDQLGTPRLFKVYSQEYAAGTVTLGGNRAAGNAGNIFMHYLVIVKPLI